MDENMVDDMQEDIVDSQEASEGTAYVDELSEVYPKDALDQPGEVADPQPELEVHQKKEPQNLEENAIFANMRRENERLEREVAERNEVLNGFFGELDADPLIAARAYSEEKSPEEIRKEMALKQIQEQKDVELANLRAFKAESTFKGDIEAIRKIYPDVKASSIDDLGQEFIQIMATSSLDAVTAYEVVRAREERSKIVAPPEIGKLNQSSSGTKDYYTFEEVSAMSQEAVHKNWEKIEKSRAKWK